MSAERAIEKHPLMIPAALSVTAAIAAVSHSQAGCALVVEQQKLVGIFTVEDIGKLAASNTSWQDLCVAQAISPDFVSLVVSALPEPLALMEFMHQQQVQYLPLVSADAEVLGLVTLKSLTAALQELMLAKAQEQETLRTQLNQYQRLEADLRTNEQAFRHSQERLDNILSSIEDVVWSADPQKSQLLYLNAATENVFGRSVSEFLGNFNLRREIIVLTDRQRVEEAGKALYTSGSQDIEYRIRRPDGEIRWVRDRARLVTDAQGNPCRIDGIITDVTERKQAQQQLEYEAWHDGLTGLANRNLLMERLQQAIERSQTHPDKRFALLFLDLDGFKVVNDSLGHLVGDQLLIEVARRLKQRRRVGDLIARHGGDEFAILLEELSHIEDAIKVARRIQQVLEPPLVLETREIFVSASIGIRIGEQANLSTGDRVADLLRDADTAMYYAKAKGRGEYAVFTPSMHTQILQRLELEHDLRRAVERKEFVVYYQPIIQLTTQEIWGFEALVRWQHPSRGLVNPYEFIPLAEETGLSVAIDRLVMRTACCQLRRWQGQLPQADLKVSVNVSGKQFSQPGLIETLDRVLAETGLVGSSLKLEITESVMINFTQLTITMLQQLRDRQVQLCLDDFGTGYSSLNYLHSLPFNVLKIDRSFVHRLGREKEQGEIVKTIVSLGLNLGMSVIGEGIETQEQLAHLRSLRCAYGQGYWFAQPMNSEAATRFLHSWSANQPLGESIIS